MGPMDVYTDQEADRLSRIMVNDPHFAADELRGQLQQLDPQTASVLIAKTKNDEYVGGLGDLQIQVEFNQQGYDSGYRNVTMATQNGVEQIAELQAQPPALPGYGQPGYDANYAPNPLGFVAGVIVGDLLWQQGRGLDFNDPRYQGWCNREQGREQYWNQNGNQFAQNWANPNYRSQMQDQNWQSSSYHPTTNNTYVTNNRIDNTVINKPVNTTVINETINNTRTNNVRNSQTFNTALGSAPRPTLEAAPTSTSPGSRLPNNGGQPRHDVPVALPAAGATQGQHREVQQTNLPPQSLQQQNREQPGGGLPGANRTGIPAAGSERTPGPAGNQNLGLRPPALERQPAAAAPATQHIETRLPAAAAPATQHIETRQPAAAAPAAQHIETRLPAAAAPAAQHIETRQPAASAPAHVEARPPAAAAPARPEVQEKKKP